jgi:hypothetical protein
MALLQFQRESFVRKVAGVDDDAARRRLVGSDTTLLWLTRHLALAERLWVLDRFAGQDVLPGDDANEADLSIAAAIDSYRTAWVEVEAVVSAASLDDLCRRPGDLGDANLRWVLMHLLEETARHAGHADIIRELIDGSVGR